MIYDIALNNNEKIVQVANESIIVRMTQEFKDDIENNPRRNEIIRSICLMNEGCIPVGLKFKGFIDMKYVTEVFYYNPRKDMF